MAVDYAKLAAEEGGTAEAAPEPNQAGIDPYAVGTVAGGLGLAGLGTAAVLKAGSNPRAQKFVGELGKALVRRVRKTPVVGDVLTAYEKSKPTAAPNPRAASNRAGKTVRPEAPLSEAPPPRVSQLPPRAQAGKLAAKPELTVVESPPRANVSRGTPEVARHEVNYYSEGKGGFQRIEDMHISNLRNALNKLGKKIMSGGKPPTALQQKTFDALKNEVTFRAQQAGELTVPEELASVQRSFKPGGGIGGRALSGIGKAMGPAGIGGGLAAFAPQAMEMALSGNPQYQQMKQQDELISQAQDFYGPRVWNSAKSPEEQRTLVLQFAQQHRPDISVSSLYGSQGI